MEKENILLKKSQEGDITAFEELIKPCIQKVYNLAISLTKNHSDSEDIVQEVFIKVFQNIKKFRGESSLDTWIYRITKNIFLNKVKKNIQVHQQVRLEDSYLQAANTTQNNPDVIIGKDDNLDNQLKLNVDSALKQLPIKYSIPIILFDLQGYDYEEIAYILKVPIGTVRSRLSRGREMLKEKLVKDGTL